MNKSSNKNTGKGIGLAMRSRILSTMLVLGCTAPIAAAPVLQPLTVYAEEAAGQQNENTTEENTENQAAPDNQGQTTSVSGQIVFAGTDKFPASITVNLLANNVICSTVEVTPETKWAFTFQNLPLTGADGAAIIYTIDEVVPEGFVKTIAGTTITNTWSDAAKADDTKKAEEEQKADEAKKAEEEQKADDAKKAEEEQKADDTKKAEEEQKAEEAKKADEAKKAEEEQKAEEAKKAEEEKKAEEAKKAEEVKKAEEAKKAAEQDKKIEDANAAAKKAEEDAAAAKKEAEAAKKTAEEAKKAAEEADKKAEKAKKAAEEAKGDSEKLKKAEEKAKKAEKARKEAEEKAKKAEEARKEAEKKAKKAEEAKKNAEKKAKKTELTGLKGEGYKEAGNSTQTKQTKVTNASTSAVPAEQQKYAYVTVKYVAKDQQSGHVVLSDYRSQIAAQTAKGYHYVGYIPTELDASGAMVSIDLVFEKD